jgi:hypothetical protein
MKMPKKIATVLAKLRYGPTAVIGRGKSIGRSERFRIGWVGENENRDPVLNVAGMGGDWMEAFEDAKKNPAAVIQEKKTVEDRKKLKEKIDKFNEEEEAKKEQQNG